MPYSLIASESAAASSDPTTPAINSTGADLLIATASDYANDVVQQVVHDSKTNTWNPLTLYRNTVGPNFQRVQIFWSRPTSVGSGHTASLFFGTAAFSAITFSAWAGSVASPFDQENGTTADAVTSLQPGSVTPTETNELVIAAVSWFANNPASIGGGFTIAQNQPYVGGTNLGGAQAYLIQTSIVAANPSWSWGGGSNSAAVAIATFKDTPSGGSTLKRNAAMNGLSASGPFFRDPLAGYRKSERERRQTFCEQVRRAA